MSYFIYLWIMGIVDLTGRLTNKIINTDGNIGGVFLMAILEAKGFDYSVVEWNGISGSVGIFNTLYHVTAIHRGLPYDISISEPSLLNAICPKKITLRFESVL